MAAAQEEPTDLQLRVAWGGGTARRWQGTLKVQDGSVSDLQYLGLDADEAATIYIERDAVLIRQLADRDYDGFDVRVQAKISSVLKFELAPQNHPEETLHIEVPLTDLISGFHHQELDAQNNQLLIQRVSGDMLRVIFDRSSLVFAPGETFEFQVQPHQLGIEAGAALRYHIQLVPARGNETLWEQDLESTVTGDGSAAALGPISVTIPQAEGVYDIVVSVYRKKTLRNTFVRSKPVHQRRVQLIVLAPEAAVSQPRAWELVDTIDPNSASWMEWLTRVPKLPLLPDFRQEPLRKGKSRTLRHLDQDLVQLAPGDWQACPLPVAKIGQPHVLEIEYPSDLPQTLGISIVEPNAVGKVVPLGLDSGVHVTPPVSGEKPAHAPPQAVLLAAHHHAAGAADQPPRRTCRPCSVRSACTPARTHFPRQPTAASTRRRPHDCWPPTSTSRCFRRISPPRKRPTREPDAACATGSRSTRAASDWSSISNMWDTTER